MTLSDLSIRNPVFAWMLMASTVLFGIVALTLTPALCALLLADDGDSVVTTADALSLGCTGPILRSTGVPRSFAMRIWCSQSL